MDDVYERWLGELTDLVEGRSYPFSPGLTTFPESEDKDARRLHECLLELERRGKVFRRYTGPDLDGATPCVGWMPTDIRRVGG